MKKGRFAKICMTAFLVLGMVIMPINEIRVQAAEAIATVRGTIMRGTTSDLLLLSTKEGNMQIKLDSNTDTSEYKLLFPDNYIEVSVTGGSDGYLHALKITGDKKDSDVKLDSETSATVTGKLKKARNDILYLDTLQGEMQIKLDNTTSLSGCSVLVAGQTYTIICERGSDAYMHAVSISDGTSSSGDSSSSDPGNNSAYLSVTGTVGSKTKTNLLYLSTSDGEMQFKIDNTADTGRGMVTMPDTKVTVYFYHGTDAYLHAVQIVGDKDGSSSADIDTSNMQTVTGTVMKKSTQNKLYLDTPQGTMELKLDAVKNLNNCKILVADMKVTITCARGSDAYMHAIDITAN